MKEFIRLNSRYTVNTLEKISDNEEEKNYLLKSEFDSMRTGVLGDGRKFIDPSGGPMIVEGNNIPEADAIVESITWEKGVGYIITFK